MDKYMNANMVISKFSRDYMDLKNELPIRPSEMAVLNIITQREGLFTPLMIAELLGVSKPMVAAHIQVLLKKGYIRKEACLEDKRSFYVLPTNLAIELTDKFNIKQMRHLKAIETAIGKTEFDELIRLLDQTLQTLEKRKEES